MNAQLRKPEGTSNKIGVGVILTGGAILAALSFGVPEAGGGCGGGAPEETAESQSYAGTCDDVDAGDTETVNVGGTSASVTVAQIDAACIIDLSEHKCPDDCDGGTRAETSSCTCRTPWNVAMGAVTPDEIRTQYSTNGVTQFTHWTCEIVWTVKQPCDERTGGGSTWEDEGGGGAAQVAQLSSSRSSYSSATSFSSSSRVSSMVSSANSFSSSSRVGSSVSVSSASANPPTSWGRDSVDQRDDGTWTCAGGGQCPCTKGDYGSLGDPSWGWFCKNLSCPASCVGTVSGTHLSCSCPEGGCVLDDGTPDPGNPECSDGSETTSTPTEPCTEGYLCGAGDPLSCDPEQCLANGLSCTLNTEPGMGTRLDGSEAELQPHITSTCQAEQ